MFALRNVVQKSSVIGRRSVMNSFTGPVHPIAGIMKANPAEKAVKNPLIPDIYKYSATKAWFSDPAVYPLLLALVGAASLIVGMSVNAFVYYKDVRINPDHKHQIIRDWGQEPTHSIGLIMGKHPVGMHAKDYEKIRYEGLGIDHNEWKKAKEQEEARQ